jgi:hypothetical protein
VQQHVVQDAVDEALLPRGVKAAEALPRLLEVVLLRDDGCEREGEGEGTQGRR